METLYQILCVLQRADLEESVRWATLEEYTVYVDIIDAQQKGAEQQGLGVLKTVQSREAGMANKTEAEVELRQETRSKGKPSNSCNGFTRSYYSRGDEALWSHPIQAVTLHQEEVVES